MKLDALEALAAQYQTAARGMVDYEKYAYYAITHHSTAIEGSTLTESQVVNLLEYGQTAATKPFEHHQMVADHYRALVFVVEAARRRAPLDVTFVRQVAAHVMRSTGGGVSTAMGTYQIGEDEFRLGTVRAGTRTFPSYQKVPALVEAALARANADLRTADTFGAQAEAAFRLHFELVSIHPFGDGNGRTARLLMNYVQAYFDRPLSIVFRQDRLRYIAALEAARQRDDGKLTPFFEFMYRQYGKFLRTELAGLTG